MDLTSNKEIELETRGNDLESLEKKPEVFAPDGPFEKPSEDFVPGPFYAAVEEVMPELEPHAEEVSGAVAPSKGKGFPVERRDFMRLFSASAMAGTAACVRRPVEKAVPYVDQPIDQIPGVPTYYATTCNQCSAGCGVVVKTREGRPVKLEGNAAHPINLGGLCAMGQASIQGLYHPERSKGPQVRLGKTLEASNWGDVYARLGKILKNTSKVGILTNGSTGSRHGFFREFLKRMGAPESNLYTWEPNSLYTAMASAYEMAFGHYDLPRFDLRQARTIVSIGSDFLDVGVSPVLYAKNFAQSHAYRKGEMGRLVQFESTMTLTGGRADERHTIRSGSELMTTLLLVRSLLKDGMPSKGTVSERALMKEIIGNYGADLEKTLNDHKMSQSDFDALAKDLLEGQSIVMAGGSDNFDENSTNLQLAAIMANILIGAYGKTVVFDHGWMRAPVEANGLGRLSAEAKNLDVLIVIDSNPMFTAPKAMKLDKVLGQIPNVVSIQSFPNETDEYADYVLPNHHFLESWGDEHTVAGFFSIRQPAIRPITDSRQAEDILLWLAASSDKNLPYKDYRNYLKKEWHKIKDIYGTQVDYKVFYRGFLRRGMLGSLEKRNIGPLKDIKSVFTAKPAKGGLVLTAPLDHRFQDGRSAHLPILQEIGNSMTTITWDSWVAINPHTARKMGVKRNDIVKVETASGSFEAAVYPMPGVHADTVVAPRGNGHKIGVSRVTDGVGVDPLVAFSGKLDAHTGQPITSGESVKITRTNKRYRLAAMQKHNDIANRKEIIKTMSVKMVGEKAAVRAELERASKKSFMLDDVPDLYPELEGAEHRWGLSIDLNKCNGCGACMTSCAIENNVPQVGRDQINMGREMHWIRLDRYFSGEVDNPKVNFQPVMCQQCNHAPCEAVCPVLATTHDPQGINAMTYNRCVGTRYCANACPYKVRRFNWWTHKWGTIDVDPKHRNPRALNPDVTVRTKGVMEKCNFCVGRIRDARLTAKAQKRSLRDGEIVTACQQTCPSDAIIFGNLKDPDSRISNARKNERSYLMLGGDPEHGHFGLKTLPNVNYLADVTHDEGAAPKH